MILNGLTRLSLVLVVRNFQLLLLIGTGVAKSIAKNAAQCTGDITRYLSARRMSTSPTPVLTWSSSRS